jgi:hypothetical protein
MVSPGLSTGSSPPVSRLEPGALIDLLAQVDPASRFHNEVSRLLDRVLVTGRRPFELPAPPPPKLLTIAMATYDDFDGVYFSLQAIRLYHPEALDDVAFLVLDNHPAGPQAAALRKLGDSIESYTYWPYDHVQGTAARDLLFRLGGSEFVLVMDSHVLFVPGALRRLIAYLQAHRTTPDLLQGPLLCDDKSTLASHFEPAWRAGMYGTWALDPRAADLEAEPFEIPMQGLGVFVCRRDAWPGLNPRLAGFGAEEGYLHEKFRRVGARTLCLPFLRWMHRFGRPGGTAYPNELSDRIRNYLIVARELGTDPAPVLAHFEAMLGPEGLEPIVEAARREAESPFDFFDAIYCISLDGETERWRQAREQFRQLGIARRVRRFAAVETPANHQIGCALSHRAIVAQARLQGLSNVLVFEDDVRFTPTAVGDVKSSIAELRSRPWDTLYLGGERWGRTFEKVAGCRYLETAERLTTTHAIAYNQTVYERVLAGVPPTPAAVALWLKAHHGIDQYYAVQLAGLKLITCPAVATQGFHDSL